MKTIYAISFIFFTNLIYAEDYIIQFQAKVKNLKEFNISKNEKFRSYNLEGTFTDDFGNYGKSNVVVISDIKDGKLLRLEATSENIFSNNEKLYIRGIREKSEVDAGVAYGVIIGGTGKLKLLIGVKCYTSVRYYEDAIFGIQKCKLPKKLSNILKEK